jgi:hypothetical protein
MGSKRTWKRQYVFLYSACCLTFISIFSGCGHFSGFYPRKESQAEKHLANVAELMEKGDYSGSLKQIEKLLLLYPQKRRDNALFQMGLIYMHPENPQRNYYKALDSFTALGENKKFAKSRLKTEALLYSDLLKKIIDKNRETKRLRLKIKSLEAERMAMQKDKDELNNTNNKLHTRLKKLKNRIKGLQNQIADLKEIDLGIEEKKREFLDK